MCFSGIALTVTILVQELKDLSGSDRVELSELVSVESKADDTVQAVLQAHLGPEVTPDAISRMSTRVRLEDGTEIPVTKVHRLSTIQGLTSDTALLFVRNGTISNSSDTVTSVLCSSWCAYCFYHATIC